MFLQQEMSSLWSTAGYTRWVAATITTHRPDFPDLFEQTGVVVNSGFIAAWYECARL